MSGGYYIFVLESVLKGYVNGVVALILELEFWRVTWMIYVLLCCSVILELYERYSSQYILPEDFVIFFLKPPLEGYPDNVRLLNSMLMFC